MKYVILKSVVTHSVCILFIDLCACEAPVPEVPEGNFTGTSTTVILRKFTYCVFFSMMGRVIAMLFIVN